MTNIEWHGDKAYRQCGDCGKLVRLNSLFSGLHLCVTVCEKRGKHPEFGRVRRVGPPWHRRDEIRCRDCNEVVTQMAQRLVRP